MRAYAYIYHLILGLLMLGVSVVVLSSGNNNLRLSMLPWTGESLTRALLWGGIIALLCVLLAITGWFRYLFPIWAMVVLVMMVRGYITGPYTFRGGSDFGWTLALIFGGLLAFLGSLSVFRAERTRRA
jgi:hypothetical protein